MNIEFRKIQENEDDYTKAHIAYMTMYNNSMYKGGRGRLQKKSFAGNPIQIDNSNMFSLFTHKNNNINFSDYFVSTKADGLRFMLLIANKSFFFIDSQTNFWKFTNKNILPDLPNYLSIGDTLIDGELLFWGTIKHYKDNDGNIVEYKINKRSNQEPFVAFLAFDILYGPINPDFSNEIKKGKNVEDIIPQHIFELGNNGSMVGPKSNWLDDERTERWPTTRRRFVLESMLLNQYSPLWKFLHEPNENHLIKTTVDSNTNIPSSNLERSSSGYFYIFISPFEDMKNLFNNHKYNIYDFMKYNLINSINNQFFSSFNNIQKKYFNLPKLPRNFDHNTGRGYSSDGLIFTPAFGGYIIGSWNFCNNKQFKWKPLKDLTIDFRLKKDNNIYYAYVQSNNNLIKFTYNNKNIIILNDDNLNTNKIYECKYISDNDDDNYIFEIIKERSDKNYPNSIKTAISNMKALFFDSNKDIINVIYDIVNNTNNINIKSILNDEKNIYKCIYNTKPLLLFEDNKEDILKLINTKKIKQNLELELQISFKETKHSIINCLLKTLLGGTYKPVSIVRGYSNDKKYGNIRTSYALIGNQLIREETIKAKDNKKNILINIPELNYELKFKLNDESEVYTGRENFNGDDNDWDNLNPEEKLKYKSKHDQMIYNSINKFEYQNRYNILNLSYFWKIDLIEYVQAKNYHEAKEYWENIHLFHPGISKGVRIDIEYQPASELIDIMKWNNKLTLFELIGIDNYKIINNLIINNIVSNKNNIEYIKYMLYDDYNLDPNNIIEKSVIDKINKLKKEQIINIIGNDNYIKLNKYLNLTLYDYMERTYEYLKNQNYDNYKNLTNIVISTFFKMITSNIKELEELEELNNYENKVILDFLKKININNITHVMREYNLKHGYFENKNDKENVVYIYFKNLIDNPELKSNIINNNNNIHEDNYKIIDDILLMLKQEKNKKEIINTLLKSDENYQKLLKNNIEHIINEKIENYHKMIDLINKEKSNIKELYVENLKSNNDFSGIFQLDKSKLEEISDLYVGVSGDNLKETIDKFNTLKNKYILNLIGDEEKIKKIVNIINSNIINYIINDEITVKNIIGDDNYNNIKKFIEIYQLEQSEREVKFKELFGEEAYKIYSDDKEYMKKGIEIIENNLNNIDSEIILEDLSKVIMNIINSINIDDGNKKYSNKQESLWKRERDFHNLGIKKWLIEFAANNIKQKGGDKINLLDVSVGRGGDIQKWYYAGIKNVLGIDPDGVSIKEAQERYNNLLKNGKLKNVNYIFENKEIIKSDFNKKFDIISCQFSLHYLVPDFDIFIPKISKLLNIGGYFIGTAIDQNKLKNGPQEEEGIYSIELLDDDSYIIKRNDNENSGIYFDIDASKNKEYYINIDDFIRKCEDNNLKLIRKDDFSDIYEKWIINEEKDYINKNKEFETMKSYEKRMSFMNITFIFEKI